jgi:hypothetical protein
MTLTQKITNNGALPVLMIGQLLAMRKSTQTEIEFSKQSSAIGTKHKPKYAGFML